MNNRVYADLNNADANGRVRLNCVGTIADLAEQQIRLSEGLALTLHCEDMEADGTVRYSPDENIWVAEIDWDAIRHLPSEKLSEPQGR